MSLARRRLPNDSTTDAVRFLAVCPPTLAGDLLALLRLWRASRDSSDVVIEDLGHRLRDALGLPLADEARRGDLELLLGALGANPQAAIALVGWACGEVRP